LVLSGRLEHIIDQVDCDIDVSVHCLGIWADPMCFLHQRLRNFAIHARQAEIEASPEEIAVVAATEVDFGIDETHGRYGDLQVSRRQYHAAKQTGRPASSEQLLRIGPVPMVPGTVSLISSRPSLLWAELSRPPEVWVFAVYCTLLISVILSSLCETTPFGNAGHSREMLTGAIRPNLRRRIHWTKVLIDTIGLGACLLVNPVGQKPRTWKNSAEAESLTRYQRMMDVP